jgi:hypothetical protein
MIKNNISYYFFSLLLFSTFHAQSFDGLFLCLAFIKNRSEQKRSDLERDEKFVADQAKQLERYYRETNRGPEFTQSLSTACIMTSVVTKSVTTKEDSSGKRAACFLSKFNEAMLDSLSPEVKPLDLKRMSQDFLACNQR